MRYIEADKVAIQNHNWCIKKEAFNTYKKLYVY